MLQKNLLYIKFLELNDPSEFKFMGLQRETTVRFADLGNFENPVLNITANYDVAFQKKYYKNVIPRRNPAWESSSNYRCVPNL